MSKEHEECEKAMAFLQQENDNLRLARDHHFKQVGNLIEDREKLSQELRMYQSIIPRLKEFLENHAPEDHACAKCIPNGKIVIEGFLCVKHLLDSLENK